VRYRAMKITYVKPPRKGEISTYFIAGDWHSEHMSLPTFDIMLQVAKKLPKSKRKLIINGDFMDCPHLMPRSPMYKKWIKRSDGIEDYFLPKTEEEFSWANDTLDALQSFFSEIIFVEGNHDWRYRDFMKVAPAAYSHNFNYELQLRLKERKIKVVYYNDWLDLGKKLCITHGMYHGSTCHKRHYEACGGNNVIFSHVHRYEVKAFPVRNDTRQAWSLPAFCDLNPHYIRNSENNWSNGFGVINLRHDHTFNFNVFQVWDNRLVLPDGKIIEGV